MCVCGLEGRQVIWSRSGHGLPACPATGRHGQTRSAVVHFACCRAASAACRYRAGKHAAQPFSTPSVAPQPASLHYHLALWRGEPASCCILRAAGSLSTSCLLLVSRIGFFKKIVIFKYIYFQKLETVTDSERRGHESVRWGTVCHTWPRQLCLGYVSCSALWVVVQHVMCTLRW